MANTSSAPGSARPVFGLALGGGGVRGLAHLGVLHALERADLLPDVICGTSAGALIGGAFASGLSAAAMIDIALGLRWNELIRPSISRDAMFDTTGLDEFLTTIITIREFEHLRIPFAAVARDQATGARVLLRDGDPLQAARASAAIRRAFPPVEIDGRRLVDGTAIDPVPVAALRELGADFVVGVDVVRVTTMRRLRARVPNGPVMPDDDDADLMIRPALGTRAAWDFTLARELITLGESAAERAFPRLVAGLAA